MAGEAGGFPGHFNWRGVLAEPIELTGEDRYDWEIRTLLAVRQRRVDMPGPRGSVPLRYPKDVSDLDPLRPLLSLVAGVVGEEHASQAVRALLLTPHRLYSLADETLAEGRRRRVALLAGVEANERRTLLVTHLQVFEAPGKFGKVRLEGVDGHTVDEDDLDGLNGIATQLYIAAQPAVRASSSGIGPPPLGGLWLGGSSGEVAGLPSDWALRIAALGQARGVDLEVIERPHTHVASVLSRLAERDPAVVVCWSPYAGGFEHTAQLKVRTVVSVDEPTFDSALLLAAMELDQLATDLRAPLMPEGDWLPRDWADAAANVSRLHSDAFVLTSEAQAMLIGNPYRDVPRMWAHLTRLKAAAEAWAGADCQVGAALKPWIREHYGIEIALHDAALGTNVEFHFDGRTRSCEPHVKVDDFKSPDECGRIHFAIDPERKRFIVHHIGLHL